MYDGLIDDLPNQTFGSYQPDSADETGAVAAIGLVQA